MKKIRFFTMFFTFFCFSMTAQTAESVTEMIEAETVSLTDVAYFAATYFDILEDENQKEQALAVLEEHMQFPKIEDKEKSLSYSEFAYFCTHTWNIKNGLMYKITQSPRYALKELQTLGYISSTITPSANVTGFEALTIISQCIEYSIENKTVNLRSFLGELGFVPFFSR